MPLGFGQISHLLGALAFLLLILGQLKYWKSKNSSISLLVANTITLCWCVTISLSYRDGVVNYLPVFIAEIVRNAAWYVVLLSMLGIRQPFNIIKEFPGSLALRSLAIAAVLLPASVFVILSVDFWHLSQNITLSHTSLVWLFSFFLFMATIGLALLEQLIRNTRNDYTWHIKFLCLGLSILFGFDLFLYSEAILFGRVNSTFLDGRGGVFALAALLVGVSIFRTSALTIQINVARKLVFHTGILLGVGIYLLVMAAAGYYIRNYSGEWGSAFQLFFWMLALSLLFALTLSGRIRGYIRFYITRNLFSTKYDYKEEWLRISKILSSNQSDFTLPERAVQAMVEIVDSRGGGIWLTRDNRNFDQVAQIEFQWVEHPSLTKDDEFVQFLEAENWIFEVGKDRPEQDKIELPQWLRMLKDIWLVIPLVGDEILLGFIVLRRPRIDRKLDWEDLDLLKTASQQTASYLGQMLVTEALFEARQFNAFNQMSAFVVHDLKTLNSQLSLMVSNAERHKSNPSFIEDMIKTNSHVVQKINFLLEHFKNNAAADNLDTESLDLVELLNTVVLSKKHLSPLPVFHQSVDRPIHVQAQAQELMSAIGHLIQNAQEATPADGTVDVYLELNDTASVAVVRIKDSGSGMTQDFIKTRLFRPFESTKGLTGMGIGVYQSRETIRALGGDLMVTSVPGSGSVFELAFPLE